MPLGEGVERRVVHRVAVDLALVEVVVDFLGVRGGDAVRGAPDAR